MAYCAKNCKNPALWCQFQTSASKTNKVGLVPELFPLMLSYQYSNSANNFLKIMGLMERVELVAKKVNAHNNLSENKINLIPRQCIKI